jgi:hypothetical protein
MFFLTIEGRKEVRKEGGAKEGELSILSLKRKPVLFVASRK